MRMVSARMPELLVWPTSPSYYNVSKSSHVRKRGETRMCGNVHSEAEDPPDSCQETGPRCGERPQTRPTKLILGDVGPGSLAPGSRPRGPLPTAGFNQAGHCHGRLELRMIPTVTVQHAGGSWRNRYGHGQPCGFAGCYPSSDDASRRPVIDATSPRESRWAALSRNAEYGRMSERHDYVRTSARPVGRCILSFRVEQSRLFCAQTWCKPRSSLRPRKLRSPVAEPICTKSMTSGICLKGRLIISR